MENAETTFIVARWAACRDWYLRRRDGGPEILIIGPWFGHPQRTAPEMRAFDRNRRDRCSRPVSGPVLAEPVAELPPRHDVGVAVTDRLATVVAGVEHDAIARAGYPLVGGDGDALGEQ